MGEGVALGGQIVARHCAMHPFDEPKRREQTISSINGVGPRTSYAPKNHVREDRPW